MSRISAYPAEQDVEQEHTPLVAAASHDLASWNRQLMKLAAQSHHVATAPLWNSAWVVFEPSRTAHLWDQALEVKTLAARRLLDHAIAVPAVRMSYYDIVVRMPVPKEPSDDFGAQEDYRQYFELVPEEWATGYAARQRVRQAESAARGQEYVDTDVDIPIPFDGADW